MSLKRLDNVGIVVDDLAATIEFFAVEDIDDTVARLRVRGAQLVGEVVQYEDMYRLCYVRGPEGVLIGLAQELR